jgi:flagellar FliL protein
MAEAGQAPAAAGGGMKKILLLLVAALAVGGSGGGVAWWMIGRESGAEKPAPVVQPAFVPLELFTVNLRPDAGAPQHYIQVGITLKVASDAVAEKIKGQMPEIRNRMLLILSAKSVNDMLRLEGKNQLARELQLEASKIVDPASLKKTADQQVNITPVAGVNQTDAPEAAAEGVPAAAAEMPRSAQPMVLGVLFTSFLIQ